MQVSGYCKGFDREGFECGVAELDLYLNRFLSQDIKRNSAVCFILHEEGNTEILGYYTLCAFSVRLTDLSEAERKALPRYPQVPMTLLGRLAISKLVHGKGLGELLLLDASKRAWQSREVIASWAVAVDAINDTAKDFYIHYGFEPLEAEPYRLFLPMKKISMLFK